MGELKRKQPYREIGRYTLQHGKQDIQFDLDYYLWDVLISCPSFAGTPVCQGDLNWFAVTLLDRGFIVHADVHSDFAEIVWVSLASPAPRGS